MLDSSKKRKLAVVVVMLICIVGLRQSTQATYHVHAQGPQEPYRKEVKLKGTLADFACGNCYVVLEEVIKGDPFCLHEATFCDGLRLPGTRLVEVVDRCEQFGVNVGDRVEVFGVTNPEDVSMHCTLVLWYGGYIHRIEEPQPQPEISFRADRTNIQAGECTTLRWDVRNADAVALEVEGQLHGVEYSGSWKVCPSQTMQYSLHASGPGGKDSRSVTISVEPTCALGWKCKDASHKAYQNADCSWSSVTYCEHGCQNGECKAPTCSPGWKCKDESHKAYQNADCSWKSVTYCEHGCQNGECRPPSCASGCKVRGKITKMGEWEYHKLWGSDVPYLELESASVIDGEISLCDAGSVVTIVYEESKVIHDITVGDEVEAVGVDDPHVTPCVLWVRGGPYDDIELYIRRVPPTVSLLVDDLSTDKEQYRANEPITFRFTVKNTGTAQITFKSVIGVRDADGATTKWTSPESYTVMPKDEMRIQHVVTPMAHPWSEGKLRWQVILIGPPPDYSEQYVETDFAGYFFVLPAETRPIGARVTIVDVAPQRLFVDDWLNTSFTVENTGETDWAFVILGTVWGPAGYSNRLPTQSLTVPKGQTSGLTTFRWQVPRDAPAGSYDVEVAVYETKELLDRDEALAEFMVDKNYSYVETRFFSGPLGKRVAIHTHHASGDVPGSLLLVDVLGKLKTVLSIYGAATGGILEVVSATIDVYGEVAPDLLAVKSHDGSVDILFLQVEDVLNIGFLYNGASFLDVGKPISPATITAIPMHDIHAPTYWTLVLSQPVPPEQLQQLIDQYAPIVYLHPREVYAPGPVSQMLENAALRGNDGSQVVAEGAVTPDTFDVHNGSYYYLDLAPDLQSLQEAGELHGCEGSSPYERLYGRIARDDESVVYARVVKGPDWLLIQYWFFYFYNDWCNKHEGDWELVELVFEPISTVEEVLAADAAPAYVAYSQHLWGERVAWSEAIWSAEGEGKHPRVFVGRGSHANYPSPGWRFLALGWDEVEAGTELRPHVVPVAPAEDGELLAHAKWAKFIGKWGESGLLISSAPRGLLAKEAWLEPYNWAMTLPRTEPLEDAQSLWAWVGSPVELHVYDGQGRHVGVNTTGAIDLEIPDSTYETDPQTGRAMVRVRHFDPDRGYRVVLKGTAEGKAHLAIAIPQGDDKQQVVEFSDIAVTPQLLAQFAVPVKSQEERSLQIDTDGNGTFEQRQEPDKSHEVSLEPTQHEEQLPPSAPSPLPCGTGMLTVLTAVVAIMTSRRFGPR